MTKLLALAPALVVGLLLAPASEGATGDNPAPSPAAGDPESASAIPRATEISVGDLRSRGAKLSGQVLAVRGAFKRIGEPRRVAGDLRLALVLGDRTGSIVVLAKPLQIMGPSAGFRFREGDRIRVVGTLRTEREVAGLLIDELFVDASEGEILLIEEAPEKTRSRLEY